jgi:hypothetical protein
MNPTQALVILGSIVATVVLMWRRGEGWKRTAIAGVIAWIGSAVLIAVGEVVIALLVGVVFSLARVESAAEVEQWAGFIAAVAILFWLGVAALTVWLTLRFMKFRREQNADRANG